MTQPVLDKRITDAFTREPYGFALEEHLVLASVVGSDSHNTHIPKDDPNGIDDIDIFIVVLPPPENLLGMRSFDHWNLQYEELDVVVYSLSKYVGLLLKGNPNMLGTLWLREESYLKRAPICDELIAHRARLASLAVCDSFAGYAQGQLKHMLNRAFEGYMGSKRRHIVEKYGYDVKNAAHCIRLLRMAEEFMRTKELRVFRTEDAEEIRDIKRGKWSLEQVNAESDRLFARIAGLKETCGLPAHPDAAFFYDWLPKAVLRTWADLNLLPRC